MQQGGPQLDRRPQAGERSGHPGPGAGRQQRAAGQHRRDHVEADVAQRPDQEHEQQPEVDAGVVPASAGPPDRVREHGVQRQHEHHERHQVGRSRCRARAPYGSVRIQTTGVGYSINVPGRPTSNRPDDLAVVVVDVADDEGLERGEDAQHQQPGDEPGEDDRLPAAAGVPPADQTGSGGRRGCGERAGHPGRLAVEWLAGCAQRGKSSLRRELPRPEARTRRVGPVSPRSGRGRAQHPPSSLPNRGFGDRCARPSSPHAENVRLRTLHEVDTDLAVTRR